MSEIYKNDTICAIATAQGGAVGIVRVSGPQAIQIADKVFLAKDNEPLLNHKARSVVLGNICAEDNEIVDEVLAYVFRCPHSYTGEDCVEFACHGSPYILNKLLELLISNGCRMASAGEYTQRAFLNGKMDLCQAEAVADLIAARSRASHHMALTQMRGGISIKLKQLRQKLLELAGLLELELDFAEEDVEFAERTQLLTLAQEVKTEIEILLNSFADGNALKNGVPVAIIGAPNVGKSTLLNALLRDDRAIVSDIMGTTRDLIEDTVIIGGILFRIIDTAGLRHSTDTVEQLGIERTLQAAKHARIIIMLTEPGVDFPDIPTDEQQNVIKIVNKTPEFQALNGIGLSSLEQQLIDSVPKLENDTPIITNLRHKQALDLAHADIIRTITSLRSNISGDMIAEDLRQCTTHLAEIVGEMSSNTVLENIFKNFCIGK